MKEKRSFWGQAYRPISAMLMVSLVLLASFASPLGLAAKPSFPTQEEPKEQEKDQPASTAVYETGISAVISQVITLDFSQFVQFVALSPNYSLGNALPKRELTIFPALLTYYRNLLLHSIMRHAP